ncbi:CvfD/Ygs/GSP13 family RNA-binding post-transcriptional regulator [Lacticaseibacillus thailandensis]|uniref:General stress protein 13 n=1 Tax=Lacticaseibacillus thailandensis DSM 22698 = JCM 13996 TaxID=1423810 RepID=A0A0R2C882_9LACO|nr:CvfD/Ygs/GSP13 family RNA-binding post-transcriptional regulator [Lacticaseibacillus thailandensis]KRM87767.1 General stress protein 13 [Lacticaseibacillus thailandensis DSM 22698 = JCM 13996]
MDYRIGDIVTGKVTGIQAYGVFIALDPHTQGLIHISECRHGFVKGLDDMFHIGEQLEVIILDIDEYSGKISLSLRALQNPGPLSEHRRRKHYWTSRKVHNGFKPIDDRLDGWVREALRHLDQQ